MKEIYLGANSEVSDTHKCMQVTVHMVVTLGKYWQIFLLFIAISQVQQCSSLPLELGSGATATLPNKSRYHFWSLALPLTAVFLQIRLWKDKKNVTLQAKTFLWESSVQLLFQRSSLFCSNTHISLNLPIKGKFHLTCEGLFKKRITCITLCHFRSLTVYIIFPRRQLEVKWMNDWMISIFFSSYLHVCLNLFGKYFLNKLELANFEN